ncbi:periplasmic heavy metal sensor [Candidatus Fermentibacteria bacterium]|nr:periplasmic heavy metal sensor [Candidatus Fermentibacteria bacterium]
MKRTTLILLMAALVASMAATADARGPRGGRGGCDMGMGPGWGDFSEVTAEVRAKIQDQRRLFQEDTITQRAQLFEKAERLRLLMSSSDSKDADILKLHQEIHDLRGEIAKKGLQHMLKIRKDLPEGMRAGCHMMAGACGMGCGPMDGSNMGGSRMGRGMQCAPQSRPGRSMK